MNQACDPLQYKDVSASRSQEGAIMYVKFRDALRNLRSFLAYPKPYIILQTGARVREAWNVNISAIRLELLQDNAN